MTNIEISKINKLWMKIDEYYSVSEKYIVFTGDGFYLDSLNKKKISTVLDWINHNIEQYSAHGSDGGFGKGMSRELIKIYATAEKEFNIKIDVYYDTNYPINSVA